MYWSNSFCTLRLSASVMVPLAAAMAFSFKVRRISMVEDSAPSATFIMLWLFWAFCLAWSRHLISTLMRWPIAQPDGSSATLFIFRPVAIRSMLLCMAA